ncbi:HU family DNA-binding protein [Bacteroides sp.]
MILFRKVMRLTDPTDQSSAKKVYPQITYRYSKAATLGECAKEISGNSGVSEGETISVLKDFRSLLKKTLLGGRAVNIEGLGYFYLSARSKGTETMEEFTSVNIDGLRICFRANNDIRLHTGTTTRTDGLAFKDVDRVNKLGEDSGDGEGGGEVIDPME